MATSLACWTVIAALLQVCCEPAASHGLHTCQVFPKPTEAQQTQPSVNTKMIKFDGIRLPYTVDESTAERDFIAAAVNPNIGKTTYANKSTTEESKSTTEETTRTTGKSKSTNEETQSTPEENKSTTDENKSTDKDSKSTHESKKGTSDENSSASEENTSTLEERTQKEYKTSTKKMPTTMKNTLDRGTTKQSRYNTRSRVVRESREEWNLSCRCQIHSEDSFTISTALVWSEADAQNVHLRLNSNADNRSEPVRSRWNQTFQNTTVTLSIADDMSPIFYTVILTVTGQTSVTCSESKRVLSKEEGGGTGDVSNEGRAVKPNSELLFEAPLLVIGAVMAVVGSLLLITAIAVWRKYRKERRRRRAKCAKARRKRDAQQGNSYEMCTYEREPSVRSHSTSDNGSWHEKLSVTSVSSSDTQANQAAKMQPVMFSTTSDTSNHKKNGVFGAKKKGGFGAKKKQHNTKKPDKCVADKDQGDYSEIEQEYEDISEGLSHPPAVRDTRVATPLAFLKPGEQKHTLRKTNNLNQATAKTKSPSPTQLRNEDSVYSHLDRLGNLRSHCSRNENKDSLDSGNIGVCQTIDVRKSTGVFNGNRRSSDKPREVAEIKIDDEGMVNDAREEDHIYEAYEDNEVFKEQENIEVFKEQDNVEVIKEQDNIEVIKEQDNMEVIKEQDNMKPTTESKHTIDTLQSKESAGTPRYYGKIPTTEMLLSDFTVNERLDNDQGTAGENTQNIETEMRLLKLQEILSDETDKESSLVTGNHTHQRPKTMDTQSDPRPKTMDIQSDQRPKTMDIQTDPSPKTMDIQYDQKSKTMDIQSDPRPKTMDIQSDQRPKTIDTQSDPRPKTMDVQFDQRLKTMDVQSDQRHKTIDTQSGQRPKTMNTQSQHRPKTMDTQSDPRPKTMDTQSDGRPKPMVRQSAASVQYDITGHQTDSQSTRKSKADNEEYNGCNTNDKDQAQITEVTEALKETKLISKYINITPVENSMNADRQSSARDQATQKELLGDEETSNKLGDKSCDTNKLPRITKTGEFPTDKPPHTTCSNTTLTEPCENMDNHFGGYDVVNQHEIQGDARIKDTGISISDLAKPAVTLLNSDLAETNAAARLDRELGGDKDTYRVDGDIRGVSDEVPDAERNTDCGKDNREDYTVVDNIVYGAWPLTEL